MPPYPLHSLQQVAPDGGWGGGRLDFCFRNRELRQVRAVKRTDCMMLRQAERAGMTARSHQGVSLTHSFLRPLGVHDETAGGRGIPDGFKVLPTWSCSSAAGPGYRRHGHARPLRVQGTSRHGHARPPRVQGTADTIMLVRHGSRVLLTRPRSPTAGPGYRQHSHVHPQRCQS